jgi:hypothetical protein
MRDFFTTDYTDETDKTPEKKPRMNANGRESQRRASRGVSYLRSLAFIRGSDELFWGSERHAILPTDKRWDLPFDFRREKP